MSEGLIKPEFSVQAVCTAVYLTFVSALCLLSLLCPNLSAGVVADCTPNHPGEGGIPPLCSLSGVPSLWVGGPCFLAL